MLHYVMYLCTYLMMACLSKRIYMSNTVEKFILFAMRHTFLIFLDRRELMGSGLSRLPLHRVIAKPLPALSKHHTFSFWPFLTQPWFTERLDWFGTGAGAVPCYSYCYCGGSLDGGRRPAPYTYRARGE